MSETVTATQTSSGQVRVINPPPRIAIVDLTPNNVGTLRKLNSVLFPVNYSDKFYSQVIEDHLSDFCKLIYYNDLPVGAVCCRVEPDPKQNSTAEQVKKSQSDVQPQETKLYIMTLGVLAPYRNQGLATQLLSQVMTAAQATHNTPTVLSNPDPTPTDSKKPVHKGKKSSSSTKTTETSNKTNKDQPNNTSTEEDPEVMVQIPPISTAYVHVQFGNDDARDFYIHRGFIVDGKIEDYYRKIEPRSAWILVKPIGLTEK